MDEDIYAKREKNITVEGSKVSSLGDLEGAFHLTRPSSLPLRPREISQQILAKKYFKRITLIKRLTLLK
jgi:hypothetical protein